MKEKFDLSSNKKESKEGRNEKVDDYEILKMINRKWEYKNLSEEGVKEAEKKLIDYYAAQGEDGDYDLKNMINRKYDYTNFTNEGVRRAERHLIDKA